MSQDGQHGCDCCKGTSADTPAVIGNRSGLPAIAYRVGHYISFRQSLQARLSDPRWAALRNLRTREDHDFTLALLDAWAVAGDILTFYQERIINESYLRTATERRSLSELARLIGYELKPGLAANTYVAFTIEDSVLPLPPGTPRPATDTAPREVLIEQGTKVLSVPGPGKLPQTYETTEAFVARPRWNAIRPRLTKPHPLGLDLSEMAIAGTPSSLRADDTVLIVVGGKHAVKQVSKVAVDAQTTTTQATLHDKGDPIAITPAPPVPSDRPGLGWWDIGVGRPLTDELIRPMLLNHESLTLPNLAALSYYRNWPISVLEAAFNAQRLSPPVPPADGVFAFRERAALFGHNAPKWIEKWKEAEYGEFTDWEGRTLQDEQQEGSSYIDLDRTYVAAQKRSWVVLESPKGREVYRVEETLELSRAAYLLSGRVTRLIVNRTEGFEKFPLRETTVYLVSEPLVLAPVPFTDPQERERLTLEGAYLDLKIGQAVVVSGELNDLQGIMESEVAVISKATLDEGFTTLSFEPPLANLFKRNTVTINGNVVAATHGESVKEILGSGDATVPYQQFILKQPPLTYVTAETPSGSASTLRVYVNEILWHEVPFLHGHGPTERIYVTRRDDEGRTTVQFGDGITGARLPTGQHNVRADYRKGAGFDGLVRPAQLSLLPVRPLGVKTVLNPEASQGAEDPETRDAARRNAPRTVLTLGRAVSLHDYEDLARSFAGIAKAQAVWVWDGRKRRIVLTVAGPNGVLLASDGKETAALRNALHDYGDPFVAVTVKSYRRALFQLHGTVTIHPDHRVDRVMASVSADLQQRYSFDAREFGQPVALSEVLAAMQSVAGVAAVDIDMFFRLDKPTPSRSARLMADRPLMGADGDVDAAELLLLDPMSLSYLKGAHES